MHAKLLLSQSKLTSRFHVDRQCSHRKLPTMHSKTSDSALVTSRNATGCTVLHNAECLLDHEAPRPNVTSFIKPEVHNVATTAGDLRTKFHEDRSSGSTDMLTDRQTDRRVDHNTLHPYHGGVKPALKVTVKYHQNLISSHVHHE